MANILKRVLNDYIDVTQRTFVPGRLITDNVLLTYEILYSFKMRCLGMKDFFVLKLYMSKAYDKVE